MSDRPRKSGHSSSERKGSIHQIRNLKLEEVKLEEQYEVLQTLCEVWSGRILLAEHRASRHEVILKALHKVATSRADFLREFHYSYFLSPHRSIVTTYDVAFSTSDMFVFAEEYAQFGDLACYVSNGGIGERNTKLLAPQLVAALDFMHSKSLVHRNVRLDNILVFKSDLSRVKLADFDQTRPVGWRARRGDEWAPYAPPEVVSQPRGELYTVAAAHDTWQLAVVLVVCLTGALPWQRADKTDARYAAFCQWRGYRALRAPHRFGEFSLRLQGLLRRLFEPRARRRCAVTEIGRHLGHRWTARSASAAAGDGVDAGDATSVCYSTWSVHSCQQQKNAVLAPLRALGLETVVDHDAKRQRLRDWVALTARGPALEEGEPELTEGRGGGSQSSAASAASCPRHSPAGSLAEEDAE
ncbi:serine/threonine-protein kinase meng-po-like [Amphibalanus amphitrite]|uniref:serine/threonine-protein kinase meng-po-like n=1 Tax=Amphibalanus amphitrite TaxID=1232801 RepID=UPI001C90F8B1|nr:serine/threonine-protein kinase meng-po-like [Amphibalanus amphitrite]